MKSLMKSAVSSVCGCSILFLNTLSCFASESSIVADKAMPAAIVIGIAAAAAGKDEPVVYYMTGEFFADAINVPAGITIAEVKAACRKISIFLK